MRSEFRSVNFLSRASLRLPQFLDNRRFEIIEIKPTGFVKKYRLSSQTIARCRTCRRPFQENMTVQGKYSSGGRRKLITRLRVHWRKYHETETVISPGCS